VLTLTDIELTSLDGKFVDLLEQYWLIHGKVPTQDEISELGIDPELYKRCMRNRPFRKKLLARGVGIEDLDDPKLTDWALSEKQFAAANIMLDLLDNRARKRKLSDLNISTQEWAAWERDPNFQNYIRQRSEVMLKDNLHEAHAALLDRVRMGDINAVKLFYELTGRYIPAASRAGTIDPMELLGKVIQVLQIHIKDNELLATIGEELIGLTAVSAFAHEIDELQERVTQRHMTPKELVSKPVEGASNVA